MSYAKTTQVPVDRSRFQIEHTLARYGAEQFIYASSVKGAIIGFTVNKRSIRLKLPIPDRQGDEFTHNKNGYELSESAADKRHEQECRRRWRALLLVIKAKLEAVESGIAEFEVEFMPYMVLPGGQTVADNVMPEIQKAYDSGKPIQLLGAGI